MNAARASVNLFLLMLFLTAVLVLSIACHKEPSKVESNAGRNQTKAASNSKDQGDLKPLAREVTVTRPVPPLEELLDLLEERFPDLL